jgi:tRNA pseudouridine55 synthase
MIDPDVMAESGILLVDKPRDWTSHDVVACIRGRFKIKKVGHCGTLDPEATGLLVVVLGRATKLSQRLMASSKVYCGTMTLGVETDSQDAAGEVVATTEIGDDVSEERLRAVAAEFVGEQQQIPPMTSAVKKDGKKLYELARKGKTVEREPREITIFSLDILGVKFPDVEFRVHCSKGTYVRTLAADIGEKLGCGGHLKSLRRERSGDFDVADAYPMDEIKGWEREQALEAMIPLPEVLSRMMQS